MEGGGRQEKRRSVMGLMESKQSILFRVFLFRFLLLLSFLSSFSSWFVRF